MLHLILGFWRRLKYSKEYSKRGVEFILIKDLRHGSIGQNNSNILMGFWFCLFFPTHAYFIRFYFFFHIQCQMFIKENIILIIGNKATG